MTAGKTIPLTIRTFVVIEVSPCLIGPKGTSVVYWKEKGLRNQTHQGLIPAFAVPQAEWL